MRLILAAFAIALPTLVFASGATPARAENLFTPLGKALSQFTDQKPKPPARVSKPRVAAPAVEEEAPVPQTRPEAVKPEVEVVKPDVAKPEPEAVKPDAKPEVPMPRDRPEEAVPEAPVAASPSSDVEVTVNKGAETSPSEPPRIYQTACPAMIIGAVEGKVLPPIHEGQCQAQSPLSITAVTVNGRSVPISGEVTTDCAVATMLPAWFSDVDGYIWAKDNTRIKSITIGTSYMCRNRVGGSSTDKLSEHGFADALDVVGFTLEDGRTINVESGWPGTEEQGSRIFRYAHDAACSQFMTTLGPEANAEHHDHLHVDMGCHGKTCTARLCE
jgi:hypothetical protein